MSEWRRWSRSLVLASRLALGLLLAVPGARAQPGRTPPGPAVTPVAEPSQTETRFYGLEIFAADAVLAAVSLGAGRAELLLGLALTGPVIHAMHDRWGAAGGNLVVRVASPFAGLYVGAAMGHRDSDRHNGRPAVHLLTATTTCRAGRLALRAAQRDRGSPSQAARTRTIAPGLAPSHLPMP